MLIKLHGIFKNDYGPEFRIEANSIAEAIRGFSEQVGFYANRQLDDRPVARVAEVDDPNDLYKNTELKEINLVPAMIGGGGGFAKILIGAALIAAAFIPGLGTIAGVAISSMLLTAGATLVLSGAMQLFMPAPQMTGIKGTKDPDASKYFGLSDNTVAIGTPIPIQYGRGPATGHVLALNVDAKDLIYGQFPATPT
jgi:predicted phage tail protein